MEDFGDTSSDLLEESIDPRKKDFDEQFNMGITYGGTAGHLISADEIKNRYYDLAWKYEILLEFDGPLFIGCDLNTNTIDLTKIKKSVNERNLEVYPLLTAPISSAVFGSDYKEELEFRSDSLYQLCREHSGDVLNPYLDLVKHTESLLWENKIENRLSQDKELPRRRDSQSHMKLMNHENYFETLRKHFGYTIPNEALVQSIKAHATSVGEIGGGNGYLAWYLKQHGLDIKTSDAGEVTRTWCDVEKRDAVEMAKEYAKENRALLLAWPPADYMETSAFPHGGLYAGPAVKAYLEAGGKTVIYIGEDRCDENGVGYGDFWIGYSTETGDDAFHDFKEQKMEVVEKVLIPHWNVDHSYLQILQPK